MEKAIIIGGTDEIATETFGISEGYGGIDGWRDITNMPWPKPYIPVV